MSEDRSSRIAALFLSYRESLPPLMVEFELIWAKLNRQWDAELAAEFDRKVHGLAGSAATFELKDIGDAARELEHCFKPLLDAEYDTSTPRWLDVNQLFQQLKALVESSMNN